MNLGWIYVSLILSTPWRAPTPLAMSYSLLQCQSAKWGYPILVGDVTKHAIRHLRGKDQETYVFWHNTCQFLEIYKNIITHSHVHSIIKLELVYLPKGKYCVYPRMVYRLAIVMPPPPQFWMTKNHFRSYFLLFQINMQLLFLFTKWLPATILDNRKSLSIAFLAISDQYATFIFVHKMAAGNHFGWPKITFYRISRHFRSIPNFYFFTKWLPAAILDDRKSLSIAFRTISDQYAIFFHKMAAGGHFGWPKITFKCIFRHFRSIRNFFFDFFFKMAAGGHFGSPICAKNNRVLPLCVINGYAKYEVDRWIYDTVRDATSFLSIFIQHGRQRPFCFSDWCQKS